MTKLKMLDNCSDLLKLLADETRLAVVRQLMRGPKHVGDLNVVIGVDQSLLSHHLKVLREGGIVEAQRDGKAVLYRLASKVESRRSEQGIDLGCCRIVFE